MSPYSIPPLISALLFISLGIAVYRQNPAAAANRGYLAWCITTFFWQATWSILFNVSDAGLAGVLVKIGYSFITFIPITYYHFVAAFLQAKGESRYVYSAYGIGLLLVVSIWTTPWYVDGMYRYHWGYYPKAGFPLHPFYLVLLTVFAGRGQLLTLRQLRDGQPGLRQQQLKYLQLAGLTYIPAAADFAVNYGWNMYPFGFIAILVSLCVIAYSIMRHRLLDLGLVMRWGLAYSILIATIALIFLPGIWISDHISTRFIHMSPGFSTVILTSLLVFFIAPLKKKITEFVDLIIFKSMDFGSVVSGFEEALAGSTDPAAIARKLTEKFKSIWGVEHAGIALWDMHSAAFAFLPSELFRSQPLLRLNAIINRTDFLVRTLSTERRLFRNGIVVEDEVTALGMRAFPGERTTFWKMRRTMRWVGASICIPLMSESELIGFIILGPKRNQRLYTEEDKKFLSHVAVLISGAMRPFVLSGQLLSSAA